MTPRAATSGDQAPRIAFIGVGRMGLAMCGRLAGAGFEVVATDVCVETRARVVGLGARWAESVTAACSAADLAVTSLPGPREVAAVADEVIHGLPAGTVWIEMSTAAPEVAETIAASAAGLPVEVIDAPVGGGPEEAAAGQLVVFAGGQPAALARCHEVFSALAAQVIHTGPPGSGYAVKLLVNALWFGQAVATAEALTLAGRLGLDLQTVLGALNQSAAASRFLAADALALLAGDDLASFSLARCYEELASVLSLGEQLQVPLDVTSAVAEVHRAALRRYGDRDGELLGARLVAERAGVRLAGGSERGANGDTSPG